MFNKLNKKLKITKKKKHVEEFYTIYRKNWKKIGICSIFGQIRIRNWTRISYPGSGSALK